MRERHQSFLFINPMLLERARKLTFCNGFEHSLFQLCACILLKYWRLADRLGRMLCISIFWEVGRFLNESIQGLLR